MSAPKLHRTSNIGFTIVELLVVIVVIGILASITVVSYNGIQQRARNVAAQTTLKQVVQQIELYAVREKAVPESLEAADISLPPDAEGDVAYSQKDDSWCAMVTTSNKSYVSRSTDTSITEGTCERSVAMQTTSPTEFTGVKTVVFVGRLPSSSPHYIFDYRPSPSEYLYKNGSSQSAAAMSKSSNRTTMQVDGTTIIAYTTDAPDTFFVGQRYSNNEFWPGTWKAVGYTESLSSEEVNDVVAELRAELSL